MHTLGVQCSSDDGLMNVNTSQHTTEKGFSLFRSYPRLSEICFSDCGLMESNHFINGYESITLFPLFMP